MMIDLTKSSDSSEEDLEGDDMEKKPSAWRPSQRVHSVSDSLTLDRLGLGLDSSPSGSDSVTCRSPLVSVEGVRPEGTDYVNSDDDIELQIALRLSLEEYNKSQGQSGEPEGDLENKMVTSVERKPTVTFDPGPSTSYFQPPRKKMKLHPTVKEEPTGSDFTAPSTFSGFDNPWSSQAASRTDITTRKSRKTFRKSLKLRDKGHVESRQDSETPSVIVVSDSEELPDVEVVDLDDDSDDFQDYIHIQSLVKVKEEPLDVPRDYPDTVTIKQEPTEDVDIVQVKQEPHESGYRDSDIGTKLAHNDSGFQESKFRISQSVIRSLRSLVKDVAKSPSQQSSRRESEDSCVESTEVVQSSMRISSARCSTERHFMDAVPSFESDRDELSEPEAGTSSRLFSPVEEEPQRVIKPAKICHVRSRSRMISNDDPDDLGATPGHCVVRRLHKRHRSLFSSGTLPSTVFTPPVLPLEESTVRPFTANMVNMIEDLFEEGEGLLNQSVDMVLDFTTANRQPPVEIVQRLQTELMMSRNIQHLYRLYNTLKLLIKLHPPCSQLPFSWQDLEMLVDSMRLASRDDRVSQDEARELLSQTLMLDYMVCSLEEELLQHSLCSQRQILKSMTYKWLSAEASFLHVAKATVWLRNAVHFSSHDSCTDGSFATTLGESPSFQPPQVVPLIERLLDLSMCISRNPTNCAQRIAKEIARDYIHLPTLHQRRLLVSCLSNPLLRQHVSQQILEDHCGSTTPGPCGATVDLSDLVYSYFTYSPPQNILTPPSTPGSVEAEESPAVEGGSRYSTEGCEELCLLLWSLVDSYVQTAQGKLSLTIINRLLSKIPRSGTISADDLHTLSRMPDFLERLVQRLSSYCKDLSPRTYVYISQLQALSDLSK